MGEIFSTLTSAVDLRVLALAISVGGFVILVGYLMARKGKTRRRKPGQYMLYETAQYTTAECRGLLQHNTPEDIFSYTLQHAKDGWYMKLTLHNPTEQILGTVFRIDFEWDDPTRFSVTFVREEFGMREPIVGEALMDEFFAKKLGAVRVEEQDS